MRLCPLITALALAIPATNPATPAQSTPPPTSPQIAPAQTDPLRITPAPAQTAPAQPHTQRTPPPPPGRDTVFLDPAHGGEDSGARLPDGALEKDINLAFGNRLRAQLSSLGLIPLLSRDADTAPPTPTQPNPSLPTPDQRAGIANHIHPFACVVLHATGSGSGIHVITAALQPPPSTDTADDTSRSPTPWDSAQLSSLPQSEHLASLLTEALTRAGLPASRGRAAIRPLISLTCPAVLVELAPLSRNSTPANSTYQARAAQAIATTLLLWHTSTAPAPAATSEPPTPTIPGPTP